MTDRKITSEKKDFELIKSDAKQPVAVKHLDGKNEYKLSLIEKKWQAAWEKEKVYSPDLDKAKKPFYNLMMFPYPSAEGMHVGNMYAFTGADVYGRFMRMKGYDVFEPMGLDGFGIHSENYAIKVGRHPKEQAEISEKNFYRQLRATGNSFDWKRHLETYDPGYYKWTQWLFTQLFKAGLAYRKKAPVNFCPSDKTVLADEQVIDGRCERCGAEVEKRDLEQWFFRITKYAEKLLSNIEKLNWTDKVKIAQRQWIGRSEGAKIKFPLAEKYNYIILHAHKGSPDRDFYPWLKKELEKRGCKVDVPSLPGGLNPNIEEQVEFLLKNYEFNNKTVLVAHSLGGVTAMKLLPRLKNKIAKLVLVAPPLRLEFLDSKPRPELEKATDWKFDFEAVKEKAYDISVFLDTNDYVIPHSHPREISKQLGSKLIETKAEASHFRVKESVEILSESTPSIEVFTTRPDTLYGATFLVLSPEHHAIDLLLNSSVKSTTFTKGSAGKQNSKLEEVEKYINQAKKKTEQERVAEGKEKTGVFSGIYAQNPLNDEKIPVWIADYALMGYGTGALFGDAHDVRDSEFAKKYNIPLKPTIKTGDEKRDKAIKSLEECYTGEGILFDSGEFSGLNSNEAKKEIIKWLTVHGFGSKEITYHLRDWLISRQRYWGPPIPMIFCKKCSWQAVPDKDLPVLLPDVKDWKPLGSGESPLASHPEFYKVKCPNCGGEAKRETDVSDTFLDSAWYFLRYTSTDIESIYYDTKRVKKWLPVNMYIGGAEHSVLHLLYSRFITIVLEDLGLLPFDEPFDRFFAHGLLIKEGAKMSKSKGNVVVPDEYIKKYGADTLRMYLMFLGPFSQGGDFYDTGIEGMNRFVRRVWTLITKNPIEDLKVKDNERLRLMHKTIKKVTNEVNELRYNTAIASLMEWYNFLSSNLKIHNSKLTKEEAETYLKLMAPFAPHITEELWKMLGNKQSVHFSLWPKHDSKYLAERESIIIVQVNGKVRETLRVESSRVDDQGYIEELSRKSEKVKKYLQGKDVKKIIYVEGKIINFVIS